LASRSNLTDEDIEMDLNRIALGPLAIVFATALVAGCSDPEAPSQAVADADTMDEAAMDNPFFVVSELPYHAPRFDLIRDEHYLPAFERGIAEAAAEIEAIANNPEPATFENTIVAQERGGALLGRVSNVFFNLTGANTNDTMNEVRAQVIPMLSNLGDDVNLNPALFARVDSLYQSRNDLGLDAESVRLIERYHLDMVRAGAQLSEADKVTFRAINTELAELGTRFSQNVLDEVTDAAVVVDTREELAGLSDSMIESYAAEAVERGMEGKFVITLRNTSQQAPLSSLENRELRARIQVVSEARGSSGNEFDQTEIISRVMTLRAERAVMLGFENHAAFSLADQTAATTTAVNDMLGQLGPRAAENARREGEALQALIDETQAAMGEESFELASHDWLYYTEMLRQERYNFDASQLKPYFELNRVLEDGVFFFAEQLYGLTFEEVDLPVYHESVRVFEVFDSGEPLGLFYFDPYARNNKRGGAWMTAYVPQSGLLGNNPVVANHQNVVMPPEGEPTLLTFGETTTMFHEFGHAVHGLLSNVTYPRFAGTSVPRDFVEYPSQVHEMWSTWPEVLANYAVHYETGEPIPQELLDRLLETQNFNEGFRSTEYLAASIVDQRWHQMTADEVPAAEDVMAFEAQALADAGVDYAAVPPRYRTPYFSHIMGGYSAGYYSYIWSEVLDAESVLWFNENGGMTRENGDHFRNTLLSKGGSEDAMQLFRDFRGADPSIEPLLERRGLN
jgi:peptidyl-dipeptidase Dcp